jgi:hypothetical protein
MTKGPIWPMPKTRFGLSSFELKGCLCIDFLASFATAIDCFAVIKLLGSLHEAIEGNTAEAAHCIGGADVTVKKIPTPIQIILLKKIRFYSESN